LQEGIPCCTFGCQQTGESIRKYVLNRFRTQNVWFCGPIEVGDKKLLKIIVIQQGEKRWFKGNDEMGLQEITYGKWDVWGELVLYAQRVISDNDF